MDNPGEKERLLRLLDDAHSETMNILSRLDANAIAYPEVGWRVKDVVGHLGTWEAETVRSLRAFQNGTEYTIFSSGVFVTEDAFNQHSLEQRQDLTMTQLYDEWVKARAELKQAIVQIAPDMLEGPIRCPWGARSSISSMIEEIVKHEKEHCQALPPDQ